MNFIRPPSFALSLENTRASASRYFKARDPGIGRPESR